MTKRIYLLFILLVLLSTACSSSAPAIPTIDVMAAARETMAAAPTNLPAPTDTQIPAPTGTAIQPTAVISPTESVVLPTDALSYLRVFFIDVGQGDATLLLAPDGGSVLIDGGETNTGIVPYLQGLGINRIDLMIATHPHPDHTGGLIQVFQAMPVAQVVTSKQAYTRQFLEAIAAAKAEHIKVKRGDTITLGDLNFNVLNPASDTGDDINNGSIVLRLVYGDTAFLFMGDAGKDAETGILASGLPVQAQILKIGHHASRFSSSSEFLAQVKPEVAIYFAGSGNPYGYPNAITLSALSATGAKIYGTDVHGTITVTTIGNGYTVDVARPEQPPIVVQPPQPPTPAPLTLEIISMTNPVAPGEKATLVAKTMPGATCSIVVRYQSGPPIQGSGLGPKVANENGRVMWTWEVKPRTTPGAWRVDVTAILNGQTVETEVFFVVQRG